ncbi:GDP-L-fucose synthase 1 [beta proteobacterium KB13]|uniref:GDP-L-fucose synthase n=1 Tax=beta proteobacterium KB13 TaxID=314607 RepID=B6BTL2_9PROT|nr:GDP-L-fucose synthase 1 [beta proteobacterium KB13]
MKKKDTILVLGSTGLIGSSIKKKLLETGYENILTPARSDLDLEDIIAVDSYFKNHNPKYLFNAAGKVGGILENKTFPFDFINKNLLIQNNVFQMAEKYNLNRVIFFGSSCMYPLSSPQPMSVDNILKGELESTSLGYAMAKLSGLFFCTYYNKQHKKNKYAVLIPNSTFGPNDNFDNNSSHVLSALIAKFYKAKKNSEDVFLWGSGKPMREFIYSNDVADASIFIANSYDIDLTSPINIGTGNEISIYDLSQLIAKLINFEGKIHWDDSKPDGAMRKLLDSSPIRSMGWKPNYSFNEALKNTIEWYIYDYEKK